VRAQAAQPARGGRRPRRDDKRRHVVDHLVPAGHPTAPPVDHVCAGHPAEEQPRDEPGGEQIARRHHGRLAPAEQQPPAVVAHPYLQRLGEDHQPEHGERRARVELRQALDGRHRRERQHHERGAAQREPEAPGGDARFGGAGGRRGARSLGAGRAGYDRAVGRRVRVQRGVRGRRGGWREVRGRGGVRRPRSVRRTGALRGDAVSRRPDGHDWTGHTLIGHVSPPLRAGSPARPLASGVSRRHALRRG
jgi:hypothetical protein